VASIVAATGGECGIGVAREPCSIEHAEAQARLAATKASVGGAKRIIDTIRQKG